MISVNTPEELTKYTQLFKKGDLNHLYIAGLAGVGKSYIIKSVLGDDALYLSDPTPFKFYELLYNEINRPFIVLDDSIKLLHSVDGLRILKELCEPGEVRRISWSSNRTGGGNLLPESFETHVRVIIITNEMGNRNQHTEAVQSRCFSGKFIPTSKVMLAHAKKNDLIDDEVLNYCKQNIHQRYVSLRNLMTLQKVKNLGLSWQDQAYDLLNKK